MLAKCRGSPVGLVFVIELVGLVEYNSDILLAVQG